MAHLFSLHTHQLKLWAKAYGIQLSCYWELFGNYLRIPWEHIGNKGKNHKFQNSKPLRYNYSTPFTQTKSTFHIFIWMKLINYKVPSHLDTTIQIPPSRKSHYTLAY